MFISNTIDFSVVQFSVQLVSCGLVELTNSSFAVAVAVVVVVVLDFLEFSLISTPGHATVMMAFIGVSSSTLTALIHPLDSRWVYNFPIPRNDFPAHTD